MKDVKLVLKEARAAIKNRSYELSLSLCKQILKEDSDNYMALVLSGVSFQETGQHHKAYIAFKHAVKIDSSNHLAWSGLVNYYEKNDSQETKPELVKAYISLLKAEISVKKKIEYSEKLCNLSEIGNVTDIVSQIYCLFKSNKSCTSEFAVCVINILSKEEHLQFKLCLIFEECLQFLLNDRKTVCIKFYCDYLSFLYKLERKEEVLIYAKRMHLIFESDWKSLRWICKIFNELYIESDKMIEDEATMMNYSEALLKLEPGAPSAIFTHSILFVEHKQFFQAKQLLEQVVSSANGLMHAWILLLKCCLKLSLFDEAVQASSKLETLINLSDKSVIKLKRLMNIVLLEVLSRSDEEVNLERALELYQSVEDELKLICINHAIRSNIKLKNFLAAKSLLSKLEICCTDNYSYTLLKAQLLHRQGQSQNALSLLTNDERIEISEWWFEIATLYWDLGQYEQSLRPCLKAVKLNNYDYKAYLLLGNYYKNMNDLEKAKKCYEKSFRLNKGSETGNELSKIYRKLKLWDSNLNLLQCVTREPANKKNCWAWVQLGLHYLEQRLYDKSVENFRFVVRIDENNMNCWESLADAYLAKGAYTSALKCYEKVLSKSNNLYPLLQLAKIKQILGEYIESSLDFKKILKSNGFYVPALKGIAETCLLQAKECLKFHRLGASRNYAQSAANYLIIGLRQRNDLSCLWKLLGDTCQLVGDLPQKYSYLILPKLFAKDNISGDINLEKKDLYVLSRKCYYSSINLLEDNFLIWYDIAVSFLQHSLCVENKDLSQQLMKKAQRIAQHCAVNNPTCWIYWNLLGNIEIFLDSPNYKLSQHHFIKAVIAENNSALCWCNLGTLYFLFNDYKLANKAYSQAQRADPNYVNSWIGQALVAENLFHDDAMDLFRHSTQLGFHQQGALGYAHWVCKTLIESSVDDIVYSIHNMGAIPLACDGLIWYTERNFLDGVAWNFLGLLNERISLKRSALTAFRNSLNLLPGRPQDQDAVRVNYGRILTSLNCYSEAIHTFTKITVATFSRNCGLALALFKEKCYKESYETYESTLHWLSDNSEYQSNLLVALSSMTYMFDGLEATKTLLFQSIQLEKPSIWSFFATVSFGIVSEDLHLVNLILKKLETTKIDNECIYHFALFCGYFYCAQEKFDTAIRKITRVIHMYPNQASVWVKIFAVLLHSPNKKQLSKTVTCWAQSVTKLSENEVDLKKVLYAVVLSSLICGDVQKAFFMAQKVIHCYPNAAEGWALLAASLTSSSQVSRSYKENILTFVESVNSQSCLFNWSRKRKASLFSILS